MVALPAVPALLALTLLGAGSDPATTLTLDATADGATVVAVATTARSAPATGSVDLWADGVLLATLPLTDGRATLTTDALLASSAQDVTATWLPEAGAPVPATPVAATLETGPLVARGPGGAPLAGRAEPGPGTVAVTIPAGALTLTAPVTPPVVGPGAGCRGTSSVVVTDTRPPGRGFTLSLTSSRADGRHAGRARLVHVDARQVARNAVDPDDVTVARPGTALPPGRPVAVAHYRAGLALGSVAVAARFSGCAGALVWTVT